MGTRNSERAYGRLPTRLRELSSVLDDLGAVVSTPVVALGVAVWVRC